MRPTPQRQTSLATPTQIAPRVYTGTGERQRPLKKPGRVLDAESRLRAMIEGSVDCIITIDAQSTILEFNAAAERTFGYRRTDVVGRPLPEIIIPPLLREGHRRGMAGFLETGASKLLGKRVELPAMRSDGSEFPVELTVTRIVGQTPPIFTAYLRDISERRAAEEKHREQGEQYQLLFETNPSPMWVYDLASLEFLAVNEAAILNYGYSREEFLARTISDIRPPEDVARVTETVSGSNGAEPEGTFWRHKKKDGSCIIASVFSSPIVFEKRNARMVIAFNVTERERAERKVRESEANLVLAQGIAAMGSWRCMVDHERRMEPGTWRWSDETFRILGYEPGAFEPSLDSLYAAVHADDLPALKRSFDETLKTGAGFVSDYRIVRPDGEVRSVHAEADIVEAIYGQTSNFVGTIQDVTARRRTEAALREADEKYRSIFDNAAEGVFRTSAERGLLIANPALARIFGFDSPSELLEKRFDIGTQGYVNPERREEFKRRIEADGAVTGFEYEAYRKDGSTVWISEESRAVRGPDGTILFFEGTLTDITERKKANEALRRSEQQNRKQAELLNLAHDAIMVRDMEDRIEFWNQGAELLYGWSAKEVIGKEARHFLYHDDPAASLAKFTVLLETGKWDGESKQLRKDGSTVIVRSRWTLVRDEQGKPKARLVINTDITQEKKIESQFLRAQRLESIGTLASGVAHDLNNILVPILMTAPLLRGNIGNEEREKFLRIVEQSAERGASIVKQVLTFARGADGDRILLQPIYLVEEIAKIVQETFPKSVTVRTNYPEDLRTIVADPTQLHQILLNLCINARDAMPAGGSLKLSLENFDVDEHFASMTPGAKAGHHVLLQVTDTGSGIPRHVIDKIFDPFFTTKGVGLGTGLGLSTVLGIVKNHGGFMNVYSEVGYTSFKVFIPAAGSAEVASRALAAPEISPAAGETILVVDDESSIRQVAEAVLSRHGYKVLLAEDGTHALAIFASHNIEIDVVITDLAMPFIDGLTLVRALRRMKPDVRVILSTGRDDDCESSEVLGLHVNGCLMKPYTRETLLLALGHVLNRSNSAAVA